MKPSQALFLVLSWNPLWLVYKSWHATQKKRKITVPKLQWVSETCFRIFLVIIFVMYDVETSWIHSADLITVLSMLQLEMVYAVNSNYFEKSQVSCTFYLSISQWHLIRACSHTLVQGKFSSFFIGQFKQ